jgi:hypothetical protein
MTTSRELPERHGKKSEKEQITYLLERVKNGSSPSLIAKELERTNGGVVSRLKQIACNAVENGTTKEDAAVMTGLTVHTIEHSLRMRILTEQIKEERKITPPKQQVQPFLPKKKEESLLDVVIEIRELLRDMSKGLK